MGKSEQMGNSYTGKLLLLCFVQSLLLFLLSQSLWSLCCLDILQGVVKVWGNVEHSLCICSSALWCDSVSLCTALIQNVGPLMVCLASTACEECEKVSQSGLNNYFCSTVILWYKSHHILSLSSEKISR